MVFDGVSFIVHLDIPVVAVLGDPFLESLIAYGAARKLRGLLEGWAKNGGVILRDTTLIELRKHVKVRRL